MEPKEVFSTYHKDPEAVPFHFGSLAIELPGILLVKDHPKPGQQIGFQVDWIEGVGIRPTAITVASSIGEEITSTDLRAVQAKNLWRAAIVKHVTYLRTFRLEEDDAGTLIGAEDPSIQLPAYAIDQMRLRGPVDSTLTYVADLYGFADTIGLAPAQFVQDAFSIGTKPMPRTTATKWIKRAKDMGLFEDYFERAAKVDAGEPADEDNPENWVMK